MASNSATILCTLTKCKVSLYICLGKAERSIFMNNSTLRTPNEMVSEALMSFGDNQVADDKVLGRYDTPEKPKNRSKRSKKCKNNFSSLAEEHNRAKMRRADKLDRASKEHRFDRKTHLTKKKEKRVIRQDLAKIRSVLATIREEKQFYADELRNAPAIEIDGVFDIFTILESFDNMDDYEVPPIPKFALQQRLLLQCALNSILRYNYNYCCEREKEFQLAEKRLKRNTKTKTLSYKVITDNEDYLLSRYYTTEAEIREDRTDYPEHKYWTDYQRAMSFYNSLSEEQKTMFISLFPDEVSYIAQFLMPITIR